MLATDMEEQNSLTMTLKVNSKTLKASIPPMFNEIWMCRSMPKEKKQLYFVHTAPTGHYDFLKSGLNTMGRLWQSPLTVDWDAPGERGVEAMIEKRFGKEVRKT
jgi:hypothetical protein